MRHAHGFTLVEAILSIVLLGILAATVAIIIQKPLEGQIRAQRRTEISDIADTALRRAARDVRLAVPNSVRIENAGGPGTPAYLELLLTRTGGRYRSQNDDGTATGENPLDFAAADSGFDTLGRLSTAAGQVVQAGDIIVVHNLGITGANAWDGDTTASVSTFTAPAGGTAAANEDRIALLAPKLFPNESPGRRFQVASGPVTIACIPGGVDANGNGTGVMRRVSGYVLNATQPTPAAGPLLASNVTTCNIDYTSLPLIARGLVAFTIGISRGGEAVTLYYEVHISNVP